MRNPVFDPTDGFSTIYTEFNSPYNMSRRHYHDKYEIFFITEGERYLFFDDKKYLIKSGDVFIIEPFLPHGTMSTDNPAVKRYVLSISPEDLKPMLTSSELDVLFGELPTCVLSLNEEKSRLAQLFFEDIRRFRNPSGTLEMKLLQMAVIRLAEFLRHEERKNLAENPGVITKRVEEPIMRALKYINLNYTANISLDFLSEYSHMSKSNFCLLFKRITGETFIDYLNTLRISQVHKLLLTTDIPLSAIAEQTGFSSVDYMTRIFKRIHTISPLAMRRQKKTA